MDDFINNHNFLRKKHKLNTTINKVKEQNTMLNTKTKYLFKKPLEKLKQA